MGLVARGLVGAGGGFEFFLVLATGGGGGGWVGLLGARGFGNVGSAADGASTAPAAGFTAPAAGFTAAAAGSPAMDFGFGAIAPFGGGGGIVGFFARGGGGPLGCLARGSGGAGSAAGSSLA